MGLLVYVVIILMLLITLVISARARNIQLRRIPAYTAMPVTVGEAVESDRAVHVSLGSSGIRDITTITALAGAEVLYALAERAALADRPQLMTTSDPITLSLGQDTLRRAYKARGMLRKYRPNMA